VNIEAAAQHWADEWSRGWREHDSARIAALYSDEAIHRSSPFREPGRGPDGARAYADWAFADEDSAECWAISTSNGNEQTLAGASLLRFSSEGLVLEQWDYWNIDEGRRRPPKEWGR
jgi:hypothetical protein